MQTSKGLVFLNNNMIRLGKFFSFLQAAQEMLSRCSDIDVHRIWISAKVMVQIQESK